MGNLLIRALDLTFAYMISLFFLSSAMLKTGGANFDIFIIPALVALAVIFYARKINEAKYIPLVAFALVIFAFVNPQGDFLHTTLMGTSAMTLFLHALWKW